MDLPCQNFPKPNSKSNNYALGWFLMLLTRIFLLLTNTCWIARRKRYTGKVILRSETYHIVFDAEKALLHNLGAGTAANSSNCLALRPPIQNVQISEVDRVCLKIFPRGAAGWRGGVPKIDGRGEGAGSRRPTRSYSACSSSKMWRLKACCSRSLARVIRSCS